MAKRQTQERRPGKAASGDKGKRTLPQAKQKSLLSIRTAGNLTEVLDEINIQHIDIDEMISEIIGEEADYLEDDIPAEQPDNDDLREEHDEEDDNYTEYDEPAAADPFETEDRDTKSLALYIVEASFPGSNPSVTFLRVPQYQTDDLLVVKALAERCALFRQMAKFIADKQRPYLESKRSDDLKNLNQEDLIKFLNDRQFKLSKEHVSRMLNALYFRVAGMGEIPSKALFRQYGGMTKLTKEEKLTYAREFLAQCDAGLNQLEKAKGLVKYIELNKGVTIQLSANSNEHDRYKQFRGLIRQVEGEKA